jgi:uncharacterized protein (DUF952 family)
MILHIAPSADWDAAQRAGRYTPDSLAREGFIHCSEPRQVIAVANARFKGHTDLVLLWIDPGRLTSPLRHENLEGGSDHFPHVYGPIELDAVVKVTAFEVGPDGTFAPDLLGRHGG